MMIGLVLALGVVGYVLMTYNEYHLDDILAAQKRSKKDGVEVRPRKKQSSFIWWIGCAVVVVLLWFVVSMNRCPKPTRAENVKNWLMAPARGAAGAVRDAMPFTVNWKK